MGHTLASAAVHGAFKMALVQFVAVSDIVRAQNAIEVLAQSLGISDEEYVTLVTEAVDVTR